MKTSPGVIERHMSALEAIESVLHENGLAAIGTLAIVEKYDVRSGDPTTKARFKPTRDAEGDVEYQEVFVVEVK